MSEFKPRVEEPSEQINQSEQHVEKTTNDDAWTKRAKELSEEFSKKMEDIVKFYHELAELKKTDPEEAKRMLKAHKEEEEQKQQEELLEKNPEKSRRNKSIKDADQVTKEFMARIEGEGRDWNDKTFIYGLEMGVTKRINKFFLQKYGLSTPEEDLPKVLVIDSSSDNPYYEPEEVEVVNNINGQRVKIKNFIGVTMMNDVLNSSTMSEELGHFYRCYFKPKSQSPENQTLRQKMREFAIHEFFGFLATRLWEKITKEEQFVGEERLLLGHKKDDGIDYLGGLAKSIKRSEQSMEKLKESLKSSGIKIDEMDKEKERKINAKMTRIDFLFHQRGYKNASRIDLNKINNWRKLFSMSDEEIKKRFFGRSLDYSGL